MIRALASYFARGGVTPENQSEIEAALRELDTLKSEPFIRFYLQAKREGWPVTFLPYAMPAVGKTE
jgi:hypothetical protein